MTVNPDLWKLGAFSLHDELAEMVASLNTAFVTLSPASVARKADPELSPAQNNTVGRLCRITMRGIKKEGMTRRLRTWEAGVGNYFGVIMREKEKDTEREGARKREQEW